MIIAKDETGAVWTIEGTLDIGVADELRESLSNILSSDYSAIVDLSKVDACDAAALQVLCSAKTNHRLKTTNASGVIAAAAAAIGVSLGDLLMEGDVHAI